MTTAFATAADTSSASTATGRPRKKEPVKLNDHGCAGMRDLVAHVDLGGTPRVRFLGG